MGAFVLLIDCRKRTGHKRMKAKGGIALLAGGSMRRTSLVQDGFSNSYVVYSCNLEYGRQRPPNVGITSRQ